MTFQSVVFWGAISLLRTRDLSPMCLLLGAIIIGSTVMKNKLSELSFSTCNHALNQVTPGRSEKSSSSEQHYYGCTMS